METKAVFLAMFLIAYCPQACIDFIDSAVKDSQGVLVHCNAGVSRSGAVVVGYLMWKVTGGALGSLLVVLN